MPKSKKRDKNLDKSTKERASSIITIGGKKFHPRTSDNEVRSNIRKVQYEQEDISEENNQVMAQIYGPWVSQTIDGEDVRVRDPDHEKPTGDKLKELRDQREALAEKLNLAAYKSLVVRIRPSDTDEKWWNDLLDEYPDLEDVTAAQAKWIDHAVDDDAGTELLNYFMGLEEEDPSTTTPTTS